MSKVTHFLPTRAVFTGSGALDRLGPFLQQRNLQRVFVVTSRTLAETTDAIARIGRSLKPLDIVDRAFARAHAPRADVDAIHERLLCSNADTIVAIGGGSVSDVTKAVLSKMRRARPDQLPFHAAVATTLSGSEFAHYFGITKNLETHTHKQSFVEADVAARVVVLDAEITRHTPQALWLSSGIKALDHAIEGLLGFDGIPVLETELQRGIRRIAQNLPLSHDLDDIRAREECLIGAWECYFAPASMILGLSHRIGHILGGTYGVPHGYTSGITLPHVTRHAVPFRSYALGLAARALSIGTPLDIASDSTISPDRTSELLSGLVTRLGLPTKLSDVEVPATATAHIAKDIADSHPNVLAAVGIDAPAPDAASRLEKILHQML